MLLPILRTRLYIAVPSARISGDSVANVAALRGTNTRPRPMPWMMPFHTTVLGTRSSVKLAICHSENAVIEKPTPSRMRVSILPVSLPTISIASIVPSPLGAVTMPAIAAG